MTPAGKELEGVHEDYSIFGRLLCAIGLHNWMHLMREVEPLYINPDGVSFGFHYYDLLKCSRCGKIKKGWLE